MRIAAIDLARGWALLGVALVNVHAAALGWDRHYALDLALASGNALNIIAELIVGLLFSHRAFPLLAFLLGYGIVKQWQSLANRNDAQKARAQLRRRYVALLIIGAVNGIVFWPGDILGVYAIMVLVALLRWPKSSTVVASITIGLGLLTIAMYASVLLPMWTLALDAERVTADVAPIEIESTSFALTTLSQVLPMHLREYANYGLAQLLIPEIWGCVFAGIWVAQRGTLERWLDPGEPFPRVFMVGIALSTAALLLDAYAAAIGGWNRLHQFNRGEWFMYLSSPLAIVGCILVTLAAARAWSARPGLMPQMQSFFIAAGKTPLTQFIGQSIIFALIFNKSLIGWHGELGRAAYSAIAVFAFVSVAGFARAWIASGYARGPLEMLWMRLAAHRSSGHAQ
jgi:uncharacterized protein